MQVGIAYCVLKFDIQLIDNRMIPSSLSYRFEAFVQTLDGFESIDVLLKDADPPRKKRADYLLHNRGFVVEQKVLRSNPIGRPQKFVDKLAIERGIRIYGRVSTDQVFAGQPDTTDLKRRMALDLARVIDDNVATADKQTSDTRTIFNIPDAIGVLIFLNESADYLRPDVIHYALANSFQKKSNTGAFRYTANNGVILISEATSMAPSRMRPTFPMLSFVSPQKKHATSFSEFSEALMREWAAFNNAPLVTIPVDINLRPK
jgi:hypothetical protein